MPDYLFCGIVGVSSVEDRLERRVAGPQELSAMTVPHLCASTIPSDVSCSQWCSVDPAWHFTRVNTQNLLRETDTGINERPHKQEETS